ncbi:MAG TPA: serine/threonine-protein kinase, partial [Myxococcaceae bacterium]
MAELQPGADDTLRAAGQPDPNVPGRALEPGQRVDRYIILERLASGGMGEIYSAYDPQLDRKVALKLMRADVLSTMGTRVGRASLLAEAKALARLNHPNVVAVHDVGEVGEEIFIAMELVEGDVLSDWLLDGPRSPAEILQAFKMAGRGLAAAHAVGLVHRDFKPLNVIVGHDGRARVLDFGLARAAAAAAPAPVPDGPNAKAPARSPGLEATLIALSGTPAYMAPEQLRREPADARTDQFAFAVSLHEALHGFRPFFGDTAGEILEAIQHGLGPLPPKSPVPPWIHALLARALSFDRAARFPDMGALLEALERDPTARRRQRWRAVGVALAAAAVVAGAVVARSTAQQRCAPPGSRWAGTWDGARRAGVQEAFERTGRPFARAASDAVEHAMDRYRADWLGMHEAACLATLNGAQPRDVLEMRTDCLDRRLAYAKVLVERLAAADGTVVENAARAVEDLQPLSDCADEQALRAGAAWPLEASRRGEVEAVRAQLASARALYAVGSVTAALEMLATAAARARATGYLPLVADAEILLAHVHARLFQWPEAISAAHRAAGAAQETGQLDLAVQMWTQLVRWTAGRGEDSSIWSTYAEALLRRLSGDTRMRWASLRRAQASAANHARQYQKGLALAQESLALVEQAPGQHPLEMSQAVGGIAMSAWYLGDLDTAVAAERRGLELGRQALGTAHPNYVQHLIDLAGLLVERGDWEEALRLVTEAEAIVRKGVPAGNPWLTTVTQYHALALAHLEVERGASPGAESLARAELESLERSAGRDDAWAVSLSVVLGEVLRIHGRCAEALPIFQRAVDVLSRNAVTAEEQWDLAEARGKLGACLLATGHPGRARAELQPSMQWFEDNGTRNSLRGEAQYLLAQAQWQTGDRAAARANAAAAR